MRLLVVEDEEDLAALIVRALKRQGYAVDRAADGEDALYQYDLNQYDLIILDLNLPKVDGLEVLKCIRKTDSKTRILILSARTQIQQRVTGLDAGANDYLVKPFDFEELHARIRALCRTQMHTQSSLLKIDELCMETNSKVVTLQNQVIELTKKEYAVLEYLMAHPKAVVSAEELLEHVWDNETDPFSGTVKYHIHTLNKKLGHYITNIRGQGYKIEGGKNEKKN